MSLEIRFSLPNQAERTIALDNQRMLIGTLLSNEVVIRAPGIDPIHAMIEDNDNGEKVVIDLGSSTGVKINGKLVEVEVKIKPGDVITIGNININVEQFAAKATMAIPTMRMASSGVPMPLPSAPNQSFARAMEPDEAEPPEVDGEMELRDWQPALTKSDMLFSPKKATPRGDVLEVVSYWDDTILEVELFHSSMRGYQACTIGDPTKAHMLAGGKANIEKHLFAVPSSEGFTVHLLEGMSARVRRGGEAVEKQGPTHIKLGMKDIAQVTFDAVRYFVLYVKPPPLDLPPSRSKDPLFLGLIMAANVVYIALMAFLFTYGPIPPENDSDDTWQTVNLPEKKDKPKPPPKTETKVAEVKEPPPPKPPKPEPKKPEPKPPTEPPKKEAEKPQEKPQSQTKAQLANTPQKETKAPTTKPVEKPQPQEPAAAGKASSEAFKSDNKLAGAASPNKSPLTGGAKGAGMKQEGATRKGNKDQSVRGVEGVNNNAASGPNLSKLGLGVGKISSNTGPGAISTNFKSAAGGQGGGSGSGAKTLGFGGGVGGGHSMGIAGAEGALNNFGSGAGGPGGGLNGSGGLGGAGLGSGFGRQGAGNGRANVSVPPGDPTVEGGLTSQEVQAVIRANLNEIRHCYEQLLQRSPSASGKIKVKFVVETDGHVSRTDIASSTVSDSMMVGCVTGAVARWHFPQPRGGKSVTVTYPFVFNPL